MGRIGSRHSSCLWFQMFGVEAHSLLPDHQRNGCNFACQSQTRHLRPDSLSYPRIVILLEGTGLGSGHRCGTFEQVLQIVIVIAIQSTNRDWLLCAPQLSVDETLLGTAVCLDAKTNVGPQLSLGPKAIGCRITGQVSFDPGTG
jgi:hypothetical protein